MAQKWKKKCKDNPKIENRADHKNEDELGNKDYCWSYSSKAFSHAPMVNDALCNFF